MRIRVQLVRAEDDRHLWAHAYDGQLQDVLLLQSDAARDIARQISTKLNVSSGSGRWSRARPVKPEAFEAYLKGRYFWTKRSGDSNVKAIAHFEQAIRQDPKSALGYSGLADAQLDRIFIVRAPPQDAASRARVLASKALEIDPALAEAHVSLAEILEVYDWNWVEAEKEYRRALELNPNYVPAHQFFALYLVGMGRFEEATEEAHRAQELDPVSPFAYSTGGLVSALARQYDRAIEQCHKALEIDPNFTTAHGNLYFLYIRTGMYDQALDEFEKWAPLRGIPPETSVALRWAYRKSSIMGFYRKAIELDNRRIYPQLDSVDRAAIYAKLGEKNSALDDLEKAWKERSPWMENLNVDPEWDNMRSEPRFQELVRKVGLPQ